MTHTALPVIFYLITVTGVHSQCRMKMNCLVRRREVCAPGSQECGPCMPEYQETQSGICVFKIPGVRSKFIGPDTMIDLVHNLLNSESRLNKEPNPNALSAKLSSAAPYTTVPGAPSRASSSIPSSPAKAATNAGSGMASDTTTLSKGLEWRVSGRRRSDLNQTVSLTLVIICCLTGVSGIFVAALCWYRLQKEVRLAQKMAYTAYKGSRHHSCQKTADHIPQYIHDYQNQKKTLEAKEGSGVTRRQLSTDSEADVEEFTIYECPGLAPTGEMEVHNPLFDPSRSNP